MKKSNTYAIFIIGVLFFIFGFVTWLNSTLIPFLKLACELESDTQAFFVTFAFYMAYFFLSIPSSYILSRTGFKRGMALGLGIMALGSLVFIPAANTRSFGLFLGGLFVQGTGLSILQTASNPYISILGPIESAAKRISIMGVCNKIAGMLAPIVLGVLVLKDAEGTKNQLDAVADLVHRNQILDELASKIIMPYIVMAVILVLLAVMIWRSALPEIEQEEEESTAKTDKTSVFQFPHLVLGMLCLFLYVGVEVMAGDAIGTYGQTIGLSLDTTKYFTTFTLFAVLGAVFSVGAFMSSGYTAIVFIALLGLANALMWPAIFPLAIDGLGKFTKIGSALLVMGIAGGAVLPLIYTLLKDHHIFSNQLSFLVVMLPSYVYILYYAVKGYSVGKEK